jgi:hypothetical protein
MQILAGVVDGSETALLDSLARWQQAGVEVPATTLIHSSRFELKVGRVSMVVKQRAADGTIKAGLIKEVLE